MISYPQITPYFLKLGSLELRWYGLAYIAGLFLGTFSIYNRLKKLDQYSLDDLFSMMTYLMAGIIVGGRLGYILFYDLSYYLANLSEFFAVWHGGMSFHGGVIGSIISLYFFTRHYKKRLFTLFDAVSLAAPLGLGLGRMANFINGELFGKISTVPWAMVFPNGGPTPRHPSQLYEAFFEGGILWIILFLTDRYFRLKEGQLGSLFLILYGVFRFSLEFFREPDPQVGTLFFNLSMGQLLSLSMVGIGIHFFLKKRRYNVTKVRL